MAAIPTSGGPTLPSPPLPSVPVTGKHGSFPRVGVGLTGPHSSRSRPSPPSTCFVYLRGRKRTSRRSAFTDTHRHRHWHRHGKATPRQCLPADLVKRRACVWTGVVFNSRVSFGGILSMSNSTQIPTFNELHGFGDHQQAAGRGRERKKGRIASKAVRMYNR